MKLVNPIQIFLRLTGLSPVEGLVLFGLLFGFFGMFMTMPFLLIEHLEPWQRFIPVGFALLFLGSVAAVIVLRWVTRPDANSATARANAG